MPQTSSSTSTAPIPVTPDNFVRAETDSYFGLFCKRGGFGRFAHLRRLPLENTGLRPNRDTLYSEAVFDLDAGPASVTTPDPGTRFLSLTAIDQDHYVVKVAYGAGQHTFTREDVGTRYMFVALRILVDPSDPEDFARVHALQDAVEVSQPASGRFEAPAWDRPSQNKVRDALMSLSATLPDLRGAFGRRGEVDPVRRLIGAASAWGGSPESDVIQLSVTPADNDGRTVYRLRVEDAPVDGFWSVTVYNRDGRFDRNAAGAYSVNSLAARKDSDGAVTVQFGGCDGSAPNCLPTMPGWNYLVRLYRPRPEVLDGSWSLPQAEPV